MTVLVVVALLAAAVALGFPPQARLPPGLGRPRRTGAPGPRTVGLLGAGAAAVVVLGFPAHGPLLGMVLGASAADLVRRAAARRGRAAASARTAAVLAACDAVAADLRAGVPPVPALESAAAAWAELTPVARAARLGDDVPAALRALATLPGGRSLRVVAAAWQVAHRAGAGLASALELAGSTLREDLAAAQLVATEMAAARATALLLGALPVGVLALGSGFGGDPVGFLLGSTPGACCLGAGLALVHGGLAWLDRIAATVEP